MNTNHPPLTAAFCAIKPNCANICCAKSIAPIPPPTCCKTLLSVSPGSKPVTEFPTRGVFVPGGRQSGLGSCPYGGAARAMGRRRHRRRLGMPAAAAGRNPGRSASLAEFSERLGATPFAAAAIVAGMPRRRQNLPRGRRGRTHYRKAGRSHRPETARFSAGSRRACLRQPLTAD